MDWTTFVTVKEKYTFNILHVLKVILKTASSKAVRHVSLYTVGIHLDLMQNTGLFYLSVEIH